MTEASSPDGASGDDRDPDATGVWQRVLRWAPAAGAGLVVVALVLVGAFVLYDRSLDRVSVDGLADDEHTDRFDDDTSVTVDDRGDDPDAPAELASPLHVLVAGSDDRSVLTPEERRELSTGDAVGRRTEAIALVRVDPSADRIDVLRFPRDLLVTRCDGSQGRINAAYGIGERDGIGGASCLVETITGWSGLPIHHVVMVDFRGFVDAVDAVGGIELDVDEPLRDRRAGLDLPAGCVVLDGAEALAFVRARHLDDDFGRIARQQRLVAATLDQVLTTATLQDPRRLGRLLTTAQRSLEFDDGLTARRMRSIAATVAGVGSDGMVSRTIDGDIGTSDGIAFLYPDEEHAEELFTAFAAGDLGSTSEVARGSVAGVPGSGSGERGSSETDRTGRGGDEGAGSGQDGDADDGADTAAGSGGC